MKTLTKRPAEKPAAKRPPSQPPRKIAAVATGDAGRNQAYIFQSQMRGVPAIVAISTVNRNPREAIASAYLAADNFCTWAAKEINL